MSETRNEETRAERLQEPFLERGPQPFQPSEQYPQHYERLKTAAEELAPAAPGEVGGAAKSKADRVNGILSDMDDMYSVCDIEPRDSGFALVRKFKITGELLADMGQPAEQVYAWTGTLDEMHEAIIALDERRLAA